MVAVAHLSRPPFSSSIPLLRIFPPFFPALRENLTGDRFGKTASTTTLLRALDFLERFLIPRNLKAALV